MEEPHIKQVYSKSKVLYKMKQMTKFFMKVLALICFTAFANPTFDGNSNNNDNNNHKPKEKLTILAKWIMPDSLLEISGTYWVDEQRLACL